MKRQYHPATFWFSLLCAGLAGIIVFSLTARLRINRNPVVYTDTEFPISVTVPSGWNAARNVSGSGDGRVVNIAFGNGTSGVTLIVAPKSLEPLIRQSATTSGATLRVFEKDDRVYVLNGQADFVETVGGTFAFTR